MPPPQRSPQKRCPVAGRGKSTVSTEFLVPLQEFGLDDDPPRPEKQSWRENEVGDDLLLADSRNGRLTIGETRFRGDGCEVLTTQPVAAIERYADAEDVVKRIATECAYVDERGASAFA